MPRVSINRRRGGIAALAGVCLLVLVLAPGAGLAANPANAGSLLSQPIEDLRYDYAKRCLKRPQRGTLALQAWLEANWRGESWGIVRCEKLGPRNFSLHSERRLIDMLLAPDRLGNETALARRMGVQGLIYNCRQWFGNGGRLGPYSYCYTGKGKLRKHLDRTAAHRDHIHIELNWSAARMQTSFWRRAPTGS
jgi:hypothetical protein